MTGYAEFLATKARRVQRAGIDVMVTDVNPTLHPWQAEIVVCLSGLLKRHGHPAAARKFQQLADQLRKAAR